jgi:hypothetical protein
MWLEAWGVGKFSPQASSLKPHASLTMIVDRSLIAMVKRPLRVC